MLKLMIADDERVIRETISTIIDWKQYSVKMVWKLMMRFWTNPLTLF